MRLSRSIAACCAFVLLCAVVAGDLRAASPKERIREKQAQAAAVLAEVNALDRRFEGSVEAWNGARYELQSTRKELAADRASLRIAERARRQALARVRARLLALYEADDSPTTIAVLLGSTTMNQAIDRIQAAQTVAAADHALAVQTTAARDRFAVVARKTAALERRREHAVVQLAAQRRSIGALLAQRKQLLSSVQAEVTQLQAQEARRQAALAAAARARVLAAQAQARRIAAAAAAAAKPKPQPRPKPVAPAQATTTQATPTPPAPTTTTVAATPPPPAPVVPTPIAGGHAEAATIAMRYLGTPYVWGGASPGGFDCSGLVQYVFAQLGVSLPHFAAAQYGAGVPVSRDQLQPGDLVFFDGLNHVGIYVGGGQMVHAPHTGDVVKISSLSDFGAGYVGARRV